MAKRLFQMLLLGAAVLPAALPAAVASDLSIAGRGASLEQAVSAPHGSSYRLLILGKELQRIKASEADEDVRAALDYARRSGAVVFVCKKDLRTQHLHPADLVSGVVPVDASDVWENGAPSEADQRLRSICS